MGRIVRDAEGNVVSVVLPDEPDLDQQAEPAPHATKQTPVITGPSQL